MSRSSGVNDIEQYVMLALVHLGEAAYGVAIRREIEARCGRRISLAAVYAALDRLQRGGLVASRMASPRAERGGRARKHFHLRPTGVDALDTARRAMQRMWDGVDLPRGTEPR